MAKELMKSGFKGTDAAQDGDDIAAGIDNFLTRGEWPGPASWGRETGEAVTPADLPRLTEVVRAMVGG